MSSQTKCSRKAKNAMWSPGAFNAACLLMAVPPLEWRDKQEPRAELAEPTPSS